MPRFSLYLCTPRRRYHRPGCQVVGAATFQRPFMCLLCYSLKSLVDDGSDIKSLYINACWCCYVVERTFVREALNRRMWFWNLGDSKRLPKITKKDDYARSFDTNLRLPITSSAIHLSNSNMANPSGFIQCIKRGMFSSNVKKCVTAISRSR